MRPFRIGVGAGLTAVVVLCFLGLYPLALVAAAVGVPVTFLLYLWDVDLYEDEPLTVIAFTLVWGLLAGIVLGLAASHVESQGAMLASGSSSHQVVWLGVVLPRAALVLAIAGPLVLLPDCKFNDARRRQVRSLLCGDALPPRRSRTPRTFSISAFTPPAITACGSRGF